MPVPGYVLQIEHLAEALRHLLRDKGILTCTDIERIQPGHDRVLVCGTYFLGSGRLAVRSGVVHLAVLCMGAFLERTCESCGGLIDVGAWSGYRLCLGYPGLRRECSCQRA